MNAFDKGAVRPWRFGIAALVMVLWLTMPGLAADDDCPPAGSGGGKRRAAVGSGSGAGAGAGAGGTGTEVPLSIEASPTGGSRYFLEPFECDYVRDNLEDPDNAFATVGHALKLKSTVSVSDKHYMRTTFADYRARDFTALLTVDTSEMTVAPTSANMSGGMAVLYFGLGSGEIAPPRQLTTQPQASYVIEANEPAASVFLRVVVIRGALQPPLYTTFSEVILVETAARDASGAFVNTQFQGAPLVLRKVTPGKLWLQMKKAGDMLSFFVDSSWGGSLHEDFSSGAGSNTWPLSAGQFAMPSITNSNSHIFFGTSSPEIRLEDMVVKSDWWYVSPTGSPTGDGSMAAPWDLSSALRGDHETQPGVPAIGRGDTVWLLGQAGGPGTYVATGAERWGSATRSAGYHVGLAGAPGAPVHVRAFRDANQRPTQVTLDGTLALVKDSARSAHHVWFWDFGVGSLPPALGADPDPASLNRLETGVAIARAAGCRFINLDIQDTAGGVQSMHWGPTITSPPDVTDNTIYGCLLHDLGHRRFIATSANADVIGSYTQGAAQAVAHASATNFSTDEYILVRNPTTHERFVARVASTGTDANGDPTVTIDVVRAIDSAWKLFKGSVQNGRVALNSQGNGGKKIEDCIFTACEDYTMHVFGGSGNPPLENYLVKRNISYENGNPSAFPFNGGYTRFHMGGKPLDNFDVVANIVYKDGTQYMMPTSWILSHTGNRSGLQLGYSGVTTSSTSCVVHHNIVIHGDLCVFGIPNRDVHDNVVVNGDDLNLSGSCTGAGFATFTWPPGWDPKVVIRKNAYDTRRFHLVIINAQGDQTDVDFSSYLEPGSTIQLWDPRDIYGAPETAIYQGSPIPVPSTNADREFTVYVGLRSCE